MGQSGRGWVRLLVWWPVWAALRALQGYAGAMPYDNACVGRDVLVQGKVTRTRTQCADGDPCTTETCSVDGICRVKAGAGENCNVCFDACKPDCHNKECGNDGCGGFCGVCQDGEGCSSEFKCTSAHVPGSCTMPLPFDGGVALIDGSMSVSVKGDTSRAGVNHVLTPSCNYRTASPELIYSFSVEAGKRFGFEFHAVGFDTVLSMMADQCWTNRTVDCNDDATPPGGAGSAIRGYVTGETTGRTYFVAVEGFDAKSKGPFNLTGRFVENCEPMCDGAFCGGDGCGGSCGSCAEGQECLKRRCREIVCTRKCGAGYNRSCGEDGCGGSCGTCASGEGCVHESVTPERGEPPVPASYCRKLQVCKPMEPVCNGASGCGEGMYCASDCVCRGIDEALPDFVVVGVDARDDIYLQSLNVTPFSCQVREGCVGGPGLRNLIRFTASAMNQGQADFVPPPPKDTPEHFEWGTCHQHYHYKAFMEYRLVSLDTGKALAGKGFKAAFCMEDTRRELDGSDIKCKAKYDCGNQGIQRGWTDSYGWSLDCSWVDVTGVPSGEYALRVKVNPEHRIAEASYTNNEVCVKLTVPNASAFPAVPERLTGTTLIPCPVDRDALLSTDSCGADCETLCRQGLGRDSLDDWRACVSTCRARSVETTSGEGEDAQAVMSEYCLRGVCPGAEGGLLTKSVEVKRHGVADRPSSLWNAFKQKEPCPTKCKTEEYYCNSMCLSLYSTVDQPRCAADCQAHWAKLTPLWDSFCACMGEKGVALEEVDVGSFIQGHVEM